jgi:hypothetical protein
MKAFGVNTSVYRTGITVVYHAKHCCLTSAVYALLGSAGGVVVANNREMHALPVNARVDRTGIAIIEYTSFVVHTYSDNYSGSVGLAFTKVVGTKILVVAIFLDVDALPVYAKVVRAGNTIVQHTRGSKLTLPYRAATGIQAANVVGAKVVIVTHLERMDAHPVYTLVFGTRVGVSTVPWHELALSTHTAVNRTDIVVITDDGRECT